MGTSRSYADIQSKKGSIRLSDIKNMDLSDVPVTEGIMPGSYNLRAAEVGIPTRLSEQMYKFMKPEEAAALHDVVPMHYSMDYLMKQAEKYHDKMYPTMSKYNRSAWLAEVKQAWIDPSNPFRTPFFFGHGTPGKGGIIFTEKGKNLAETIRSWLHEQGHMAVNWRQGKAINDMKKLPFTKDIDTYLRQVVPSAKRVEHFNQPVELLADVYARTGMKKMGINDLEYVGKEILNPTSDYTRRLMNIADKLQSGK